MVIDRVQPVPYGAGSLSMLILARVGLAVAGGLCLAAADRAMKRALASALAVPRRARLTWLTSLVP